MLKATVSFFLLAPSVSAVLNTCGCTSFANGATPVDAAYCKTPVRTLDGKIEGQVCSPLPALGVCPRIAPKCEQTRVSACLVWEHAHPAWTNPKGSCNFGNLNNCANQKYFEHDGLLKPCSVQVSKVTGQKFCGVDWPNVVRCKDLVPVGGEPSTESPTPSPTPAVVNPTPLPPTPHPITVNACVAWKRDHPDWTNPKDSCRFANLKVCANKKFFEANGKIRPCTVKISQRTGNRFCGTDTPNVVQCDQDVETPCETNAPSSCDVNQLNSLLESSMNSNPKFAAQVLRMSFHDAGTFSSANGQSGANGCLLNDPEFISNAAPENGGLREPVGKLKAIKDTWESALSNKCVRVSSADMIQYAALFAVVHTLPGADQEVHEHKLSQFRWGRQDEANCNVETTKNLPGFQHRGTGLATADLKGRLEHSGQEIFSKMVVGNGFTARQAVALIGAHTIGQTRSQFGGGSFAGPWVDNGHEDFSGGPVFDNTFFTHMIDEINAPHKGVIPPGLPAPKPFNRSFNDWMQLHSRGAGKPNLQWLDTDLTLAFPHTGNAHPNYFEHSKDFAASNDIFLTEFFAALDVMSLLGVSHPLEVSQQQQCSRSQVVDASNLLQVDLPAVEVATADTAEDFLEQQLAVLVASVANDPSATADTKALFGL